MASNWSHGESSNKAPNMFGQTRPKSAAIVAKHFAR